MNDSLKQDGLPEPRFRSGVKVLFSFALRIQQGFFSIGLPRFGAGRLDRYALDVPALRRCEPFVQILADFRVLPWLLR